MDSESLPNNVIPQDIMLQINEPEDNLQTKKHKVNQITEALNKLEIHNHWYAFTQESFCNDLVHWIIVDDQPFTVVQNTFFQKMIKRLNSNAIIPSSDTIHNDIIKIFNDEKEFLKNKL
ncbi:zinc finger BED domain-containing protein RICESLEEPER 1-like [Rhizophagus clarus]|uniref:Zinc finger BED domain-containing protein RICESLEEPER 1-like n=1 Tax=Rhizophagus clarus TaxID=94130 RepID=A0A8H3KSV9_9GLOM|nr:zinc finger BED domain-containing protein RICESLEEPER 1-like [Rhizophagus clarus]